MIQSLRSSLTYEPQILRFGTSGRRGLVVDLTQLEVYINALAELEYLQSLPVAEGGITKGDEIYFARDLRPSSSQFAPEAQGRGEIAQAVAQAITDAGMTPVNMGAIPTPALASYAIARNRGSIMITGSHIPFDRNGYKTNTSKGELLKEHELPIAAQVEKVRARMYEQPAAESPFDATGRFKDGHRELPPEQSGARDEYFARYTGFFPENGLRGKRLLVYQHSAVGRDFLVELLESLGAQVVPVGRSEEFVPIDTENIDDAQLRIIQQLADQAISKYGAVDAVVSTDGDSDRPLILAPEQTDRKTYQVRFFGGDLVGMIVAEYLRADAVVVPVSCNDAIDRGPLAKITQPKTKIGSPFVIAGMQKALEQGSTAVCGWEANGGFLTGSDIVRNGRTLRALPTRDAILPILSVLFASRETGLPLTELFRSLPRRYSRAALLKNFPRAVSLRIVDFCSSPSGDLRELQQKLSPYFLAKDGFGNLAGVDYTDGVRITFDTGDVAHLRPSGNADELRIYCVADAQERADEMARLAVAEPAGILRSLERTVRQ